MRLKVEGMEYLDADEIAELWGFASKGSVFACVSRAKREHPESPFPVPDMIIDHKFFWGEDLIPQIMAWRRRQVRGM